MSTASDIAALKSQVAALNGTVNTLKTTVITLQQRATRAEIAVQVLQGQLAKVKKG